MGGLVEAEVEDLDDVGVHEPRDRQRLAAEARDELVVVGQVLGQQLDGHVALEAIVEGAHDGRHAADAQALAQLVAVREDLAGHHGIVTPPDRRCRPCRVSVPVVVPRRAGRPWCRSASWVGPGVGPGRARIRRAGVGRRPCRWSSVSVVLVSVWVGCVLGLRLAARGRDLRGEVLDAATAGAGAGARRRCRAGRATRSGPWPRARCAADAVAGAVVGGDLVQRARQARGVARGDPAVAAAAGDEEGGARRPAASAASGGRTRILIDRTPGARPGSQAGARRGSRPRRRRCRTRCAASARSRRSVSSSSQAARGVAVARLADAARVEDPLAVGDVDLLAAAARRPGGRLALGAHEGQRHVRVPDEATRRSGWASRHSSASSAQRTYSQTGSRGRGVVEPDRRARTPEGFSEDSQSRWPASMTSCVQRAASAAPVENSSRSRSPVTARSWLPARQTSACWRGQRDSSRWDRRRSRRCRPGTRSPRAGLRLRRRRAPPRRRGGCRGCRRRWRPAWISRPAWAVGHSLRTWNAPAGLPWPWLLPSSSRRRRSCCCGHVTASSRPCRSTPRSYFTPAELERARDYRHGQLALFGAAPAIEAALLVLARARARRARAARAVPAAGARGGGRRRGAVGGARRRPAARSAPISHQRAVDVGLVDPGLGRRGWATSAKSTAIGAVFAGVGAARRARRSCAASRAAGGCPAASLVVGFADGLHLPGPGRPRPDLQPLHRAARGAHARATCSRSRARRASTSARSTRSTPAGARRRPTPTSPGWGATKRVVLYDNLLKDFTRDEVRLVVAHELGHVHYRDVPRGLLYLALVAPAALFAASRCSRGGLRAGRAAARARRRCRRWRSRSRSSASA